MSPATQIEMSRVVTRAAGATRPRAGFWVRGLLLLAVALTSLGAVCASASAATVRPFLYTFNGSATDAGGFFPSGVAVDNSTGASAGDAYVFDAANTVIDKFSAAGAYQCDITGAGSGSSSPTECSRTGTGVPGGLGNLAGQGAVDPAGDLWVPDAGAGTIDEFSPAGAYLTQLLVPNGALPTAVAVDPTGNLLVADALNDVVDEYQPASSSWTTFATGTSSGLFGAVNGVAVDDDPSSPAFGDVYVADFTAHAVDIFKPSANGTGTFVSPITGTPGGPFGVVSQVFVDAGTGDLYVATAGHVAEFSPSGSFITEITLPANGSANSIAVNDSTDDVYTTDSQNHAVDVFGPAVVVPDVSTTAPTAPQTTTVTLNGQVDPAGGGNVTGCEFEYVAQAQFSASAIDPYTAGKTQNCSPVTPYSAVTTVTGALTGLAPSTTYHYRLDASNASGTNYSTDGTFTTAGPPTVDAESSTGVSRTCSTLQAQVNPHGLDTTVQFEYGTDTTYGHTTPTQDIGTALADQSVSAQACGLAPGITYHYRAVAVNSAGTIDGADQTLTTVPVASLDGQWASAQNSTATLTAEIDPLGLDTTCQLQWVSAAGYQSSGYAHATSVPCSPADLGAGSSDQAATVALSGLEPSSTYHYRFVVTNSSGSVTGSDQSFATWGVQSFSFATTDNNGNPFTQAGGHPYELTTSFAVNQNPTPTAGTFTPTGLLKDVIVHLPPGLIGNPTAVPQCPDYAFTQFQCSPDSQIGTFTVTSNSGPLYDNVPMFNLVPPPGVPAEFGTAISLSAVAYITAGVRTGSDYGVDADSLNITGVATPTSVSVTLWGVPADPSHFALRGCPFPASQGAIGYQRGCPSSAPLTPFLTLPTSCTGSQPVGLQIDSYQDPGDYATASQSLPTNTGCNKLDFTPSLSIQPDTTAADSPSGLNVDLHVPQNQNPSGLAEANLQNASVTLPAGVSVDPSAAAGLTSCTPAEIGMSNGNAPSCPANSKVGTVEIDSPLLSDPLQGGIYVAQQNQNPFNSLLAIYLTAYADGVWVKLAGHVVPNPVTGQLTTTFDTNPQLPFTDFKLNFFGGSQGILATPQQCGTYTTTSDLSSYAGGPDATPSDSFTINSGCVNGFAPTFTAGTINPQAGHYSPFVLSLTRADTDQSLGDLSVKLPDGMLAKLNGVAECSDADLAAAAAATGTQEEASPSCPASSQVGTVEAGAGVGPDPYFLSGKVYLTGPYKGGPYGLAVVVPAVAGPYDLGTVVVRQALDINPTTAQVTDVSDPFPTILQGIPMDIRRIDVDLNRPGFTVNPTSCTPSSVNGTVTSTGGETAKLATRFQVDGCAALSFAPKLKLGLSGKGQTKSGDHPTLTATLTQGRGQANIRRAKVALPLSMALDPNNSQHVCNYDVAAAVHGGAVGCPAATVVGTATADTPLLSKPLTGKVYLVQGFRTNNKGQRIHTLPTLLVPLRGQIAIDLRAQTSVNAAAQLVTTFGTIPDAQISKFTLKITGGPKGLLVITGRGQTICGKPQIASENLGAQSGKSMVGDDTLETPCSKAKAKKSERGRRTKKQ